MLLILWRLLARTPPAGKADFDARLSRVMGRISKTRAFLANRPGEPS